jgi:cardiolipin synthase A/B
MRTASAANRLVIGSHRLGSTARPGALLPGEHAASRTGITPVILYSLPSGPLKKRHARQLQEEAAQNGVRLIKAGKTLLHGKFLAWDDDDLVVTRMNWASADPDFAWGEIGLHIQAPEVADMAPATLAQTFPDLR